METIPGEAPDRVEREVSRILAELQRADPDFAATFNLLRSDPGFRTDSGSELVKLLRATQRKVCDHRFLWN